MCFRIFFKTLWFNGENIWTKQIICLIYIYIYIYNGFIDITRVIFACIVALYHFYSAGAKHFHAGYLGVEFFAILAGFLMFSKWKKSEAEGKLDKIDARLSYWKSYMSKRYFRFFWYSLFAFIITYFVGRVWSAGQITSAESFSDYAVSDIWEILMLTQSGINKDAFTLNIADWTLSSTLIVEFLVIGLMVWLKKPFLSLIMPCSLLIGAGIFFHLESQSVRFFVLNLFTVGVLRIYILTCLGILTWYLCKKLSLLKLKTAGRIALTAIEVMGLIWIIMVACFKTGTYYMYCFSGVAMIVIAISFSRQGYIEQLFKGNKITKFLGEYSFCIYLTHVAVLKYYEKTYTDINERYGRHFEFIIVMLLAALLFYLFMRGFYKLLPKIKNGLKKAFSA